MARTNQNRGGTGVRPALGNSQQIAQAAAQAAVQLPDPPTAIGRLAERDTGDLLHALEDAFPGSTILTYFTCDEAQIADGFIPILAEQLYAAGKCEKIVLCLYTRGGATVVPWTIVQAVRQFTDDFTLAIPFRAHSAGTHLALGANQLVMCPLAELSPVDPSRTHPLLPRSTAGDETVTASVQDLKSVLRFIKQQTASAELDGNAMAQVLTALFGHVHPLALGAMESSYELSKQISRNCLTTHLDPIADAQKIDAIVDSLSDGFYEHAYTIDRTEARAIGLSVVDADPKQEAALWDFYTRFAPMSAVFTDQVNAGVGVTHVRAIAHCDGPAGRYSAIQMAAVDQQSGQVAIRGDAWFRIP